MSDNKNALKMVIMRGVPGSGKSTLARKIYEVYRGSKVILSTDDIMSADHYYLWDREAMEHAHKVNQIKAAKACSMGIGLVIIDNTNIDYRSVLPYAKIARDFHYEIELVSSNTPWAQDADECFKRNTHNVPLSSIQSMLRRFEPDSVVIDKINLALDIN